MRAQALALLSIMAAVPLSGCVVAAAPLLAGAAITRSEVQRKKRIAAPTPPAAPQQSAPATAPEQASPPEQVSRPEPKVELTVGPPGTAASPIEPAFASLIEHVGARATLWREGAPIKSLVLDNKQTVLNPIAIDCERRAPAVLIDLDPATTGTSLPLADMLATPGWSGALAALRDLDVGVIWITDRPVSDSDAVRARLIATGLDPMSRDTVVAPLQPGIRKQALRLEQARRFCVLAVVGDKRGDVDESYDYLRNPDAVLPIDSNWNEGWFLLPPPLAPRKGE